VQLKFKQTFMTLHYKADPNVMFSFLISFQIQVEPEILHSPLSLKAFINKHKLERSISIHAFLLSFRSYLEICADSEWPHK